MNESGTNSVKPPVRSWSSRTTRMCSASSQGSSMWPNMTVTVLRTPGRVRGLDDLHPARDGQLVRRDALAHAVVEHLRCRARGGAEPGVLEAREHLGQRQVARHEVQLHRASRRAGGCAAPRPWRSAASARSRRASSPGGCPTACRSPWRRRRPPRAPSAGTPPRSARRRRASAGPGRSRRTRSRRCTRSRR